MKTIIKKVPDEDVCCDWNEQIDLTEVKDDIVILGDPEYVMFGEGLPSSIIMNDYYDTDVNDGEEYCRGYDYDTIEELNKICGGDWKETTFHGYSQGDWCQCFYNKNKVSEGLLKELDIYIMGKVDEFIVQETEDEDDVYHVFIPHEVCWKGKKAICEFLCIDPKDATVLEDNGYTKVYNYKEIE